MASTWDLTQAQLGEIESQVALQPLVGPPLPLASLEGLLDVRACVLASVLAHPAGSARQAELLPGFRAIMQREYTFLRRVRGDGNCFYRALMFRLVCLSSVDAAFRAAMLAKIRASLEELVAVGYERIGVETFQEMLVELLCVCAPTRRAR
jgi:ubiquitin thioesterase protein OTUB1